MFDSNFKEFVTGTIIYKDKEPDHTPPPNYVKDDEKPWLFHPVMPECKHRTVKDSSLAPCIACPKFKHHKCAKFNNEVTTFTCTQCKEAET